MLSMLKDCLITRVSNAAVAGTTDIDTDVLDMTGYDGVMFVAALGDATSTSVLELHAYGNTASSISSPTPVEITDDNVQYTAGASDADNKLLVLDVVRPSKRYIFARLRIDTANCVVDGIIAIQYRSRNRPVTQGSTVLASALVGPQV